MIGSHWPRRKERQNTHLWNLSCCTGCEAKGRTISNREFSFRPRRVSPIPPWSEETLTFLRCRSLLPQPVTDSPERILTRIMRACYPASFESMNPTDKHTTLIGESRDSMSTTSPLSFRLSFQDRLLIQFLPNSLFSLLGWILHFTNRPADRSLAPLAKFVHHVDDSIQTQSVVSFFTFSLFTRFEGKPDYSMTWSRSECFVLIVMTFFSRICIRKTFLLILKDQLFLLFSLQDLSISLWRFAVAHGRLLVRLGYRICRLSSSEYRTRKDSRSQLPTFIRSNSSFKRDVSSSPFSLVSDN